MFYVPNFYLFYKMPLLSLLIFLQKVWYLMLDIIELFRLHLILGIKRY